MALLFVSGCFSFPSEVSVHTLSGYTMGTSYHIKLVATDSQASALHSDIESYLSDFNDMMSTYLDDSELSLFNASSAQNWIEVSDDLFAVVALAQQVAEKSSGAYDASVAPLVDLWGFGPAMKPEKTPSQADIDLMLAQVGYEKLKLDESRLALYKEDNIKIDLSSIAKGYGVDKVAQLIETQGIENYLVEIGGEMRIKGEKPNGKKWVVAIETPDSNQRAIFETIAVSDGGFATSGDYRNFFEIDGVRYSHTIDPKTGYPITHDLASVTVIASTSAKADAWATALNVVGFEQAKQLAQANDLSVFLIRKSQQGFEQYATGVFRSLISQ